MDLVAALQQCFGHAMYSNGCSPRPGQGAGSNDEYAHGDVLHQSSDQAPISTQKNICAGREITSNEAIACVPCHW